MNIFPVFKKLKEIAPDPAYTLRSRTTILLQDPLLARRPFFGSAVRLVTNSLQLAVSIGLTGLLLFIMSGAFSRWGAFVPLKLSSLNPTSLQAEAEVVDSQIRLANITYFEPTTVPGLAPAIVAPIPATAVKKVSQALAVSAKDAAKSAGTQSSPTPTPTGGNSTPSSTLPELSIDQALQSLEQ